MKLSELKKVIKEEFDFEGSDLDPQTAKEIDIIIAMGQALLDYHNGKYRNFNDFKSDLIILYKESSISVHEEAFAEFVENNIGNMLPNQSSGSFLSALIDVDGILTGLGYEDGKFTDEQYDAATEYYESRRRELNY